MKVGMFTREYPPEVYGGAGVHVNELAKVLRPLADVRVHAFGGPREPGTEGADAAAGERETPIQQWISNGAV